MIKLHLKEIEHTLSEKQVVCAANSTDGWSGSEMENLCRDCAMAPVRECIRHVVLAERRLLQDYTEDGGGYAKGEDLQSVTELDEAFESLRPVTLDDFLFAVRMWTNRRIDSAQNEGAEGHGHSVVHYDSSSDEDET
jgi:SpoVK/Ycf46/Vps4 family AAA+-type ATPase